MAAGFLARLSLGREFKDPRDLDKQKPPSIDCYCPCCQVPFRWPSPLASCVSRDKANRPQGRAHLIVADGPERALVRLPLCLRAICKTESKEDEDKGHDSPRITARSTCENATKGHEARGTTCRGALCRGCSSSGQVDSRRLTDPNEWSFSFVSTSGQ